MFAFIKYIFKTKYTASIINSKWEPLKRNLKIVMIPRKGELILFEDQYYEVLNVIHRIDKIQDVFIVIEELSNKK